MTMLLLAGLGPVISSNPISFLFGCLMVFPLIIWVVMLMRGMVGGEVDGITGAVGIGLALILLFAAMKPPAPWISPLIFFGMILLAILLPFIQKSLTQRELRNLELDQLEKHMSALIERPDRTMSRLEVARALMKFGLIGHAIGLAEPIRQLSGRQFSQEQREVRQWEQYATPQNSRPISCSSCGTPGDVNRVVCTRCRAPYVMRHLRGTIVGGAMGRKLIVGWILGVGLLFAIPSIAVSLPPVASLILIPIVLVLGGYTAYRAFFAHPLNQS